MERKHEKANNYEHCSCFNLFDYERYPRLCQLDTTPWAAGHHQQRKFPVAPASMEVNSRFRLTISTGHLSAESWQSFLGRGRDDHH